MLAGIITFLVLVLASYLVFCVLTLPYMLSCIFFPQWFGMDEDNFLDSLKQAGFLTATYRVLCLALVFGISQFYGQYMSFATWFNARRLVISHE